MVAHYLKGHDNGNGVVMIVDNRAGELVLGWWLLDSDEAEVAS